jgi:N-acetylneuraminic acid mutarotase
MPTARANAEIAVVNNNIFVMGGKDKDNNKLDVVEIYNPVTNKWITGTKMKEARAGFGAIAFNSADTDNILVAGGLGKTELLSSVDIASVEKNK